MNQIHTLQPLRFRAIWISDIHLGSRGCKSQFLLDFLKSTHSEYLYLVGDILDLWSMERGFYWPQEHNNVVRKVLDKANNGTKVIYIPGNHDGLIREYNGMVFGNVQIHTEYIHSTIDGRRFLILHGDEFDSFIGCNKLIEIIGDWTYQSLLRVNRWVNHLRRSIGLPYWSLSTYLKHRVKNAVKYINNFEEITSQAVRKRAVDGLICGHIHHAAMKQTDGFVYCNDGDWIESCTALVENHDGSLHLMHWADEKKTLAEIASSNYNPVDKIA